MLKNGCENSGFGKFANTTTFAENLGVRNLPETYS